MLCAPDPCECFAPKAKAKPAPRKRPVEEVPLPGDAVEVHADTVAQPPRQDLRAKMKAAATQAPAFQKIETKQPRVRKDEGGFMEQPAPPAKAAAPRPTKSDEQLLHEAALRALEPIMSSEDREQYRMIVSVPPSPGERKAEWKARRAWSLQNT